MHDHVNRKQDLIDNKSYFVNLSCLVDLCSLCEQMCKCISILLWLLLSEVEKITINIPTPSFYVCISVFTVVYTFLL